MPDVHFSLDIMRHSRATVAGGVVNHCNRRTTGWMCLRCVLYLHIATGYVPRQCRCLTRFACIISRDALLVEQRNGAPQWRCFRKCRVKPADHQRKPVSYLRVAISAGSTVCYMPRQNSGLCYCPRRRCTGAPLWQRCIEHNSHTLRM